MVAAGEDYPEILAAWRAAEARSASGLGGPQAMEDAAQKLRAWLKQQGPDFNWQSEQQRASFDLIEFALAKAWVRAGNYNKALEYLEKEASTYLKTEGIFLESTRDPSSFAKDVFALHSEIIAHTGLASSIPGSGYDVFAAVSDDKSPAFIFVYGSDGEFQSEFKTEGIEAGEQKKMIYLFTSSPQGGYAVADRAQVIADRTHFTVSVQKKGNENHLMLGGINKIIEYKPISNYPDVKTSPRAQIDLLIGMGKIEQPLAAIDRLAKQQKNQDSSPTSGETPSPIPAPSFSPPPSPDKPSETGPVRADDKQTSLKPWSVVAALIATTTGLLWLLLKNRKKSASPGA